MRATCIASLVCFCKSHYVYCELLRLSRTIALPAIADFCKLLHCKSLRLLRGIALLAIANYCKRTYIHKFIHTCTHAKAQVSAFFRFVSVSLALCLSLSVCIHICIYMLRDVYIYIYVCIEHANMEHTMLRAIQPLSVSTEYAAIASYCIDSYCELCQAFASYCGYYELLHCKLLPAIASHCGNRFNEIYCIASHCSCFKLSHCKPWRPL